MLAFFSYWNAYSPEKSLRNWSSEYTSLNGFAVSCQLFVWDFPFWVVLRFVRDEVLVRAIG